LYLAGGSGYTIIRLSKFTELYKKNADFAVFKLKNKFLKKQQKEFRVEELTEWTRLKKKKNKS